GAVQREHPGRARLGDPHHAADPGAVRRRSPAAAVRAHRRVHQVGPPAAPHERLVPMTVLHVSPTGSDSADGAEDTPLRTVSRAAALAVPGDTVRVRAGEYREWVRPARGGLSDQRRIVYEAAPGEQVVIKGSEPVTAWHREEGDVWRAQVPNALFPGV